MKQVSKLGIDELEAMAEAMYGDLVKAVVDVSKRVMVVDAGLHADEEQLLLETGSRQTDLWGINLYPESFGEDDFIEFDSMINIRPAQQNRSRSVESSATRTLIREIVEDIIDG